jgi:transcriptional regulator GlxA family with amidase domain
LTLLFDEFRRSVSRSGQALERRQQALALMARAGATPASQDEAPGVGRRQFERQFSALFGMSPKQFQLIARHNSTLQQALVWPEQGGAELALAGGYCDQSHMGRDMRRFAGQPLEALRGAERPGADEHWPLEVAAQGDPVQPPAERGKR